MEFVERLRTEPLLIKAYTAQAIVSMQDRLEDAEVAALSKAAGYSLTAIDDHFSDVSKLSHGSLRDYATSILADLAATKSDALCKAFCTPSGSLSKAMFPAFSASKLLLENACYFPGMTLTVSSNPMEQIDQTSNDLVKEMPSLKALGKDLAEQEAAVEKQLASVRKEAEKVKGGEDRVEEKVKGGED